MRRYFISAENTTECHRCWTTAYTDTLPGLNPLCLSRSALETSREDSAPLVVCTMEKHLTVPPPEFPLPPMAEVAQTELLRLWAEDSLKLWTMCYPLDPEKYPSSRKFFATLSMESASTEMQELIISMLGEIERGLNDTFSLTPPKHSTPLYNNTFWGRFFNQLVFDLGSGLMAFGVGSVNHLWLHSNPYVVESLITPQNCHCCVCKWVV